MWFEDSFFWVDSQPHHCKGCRAELRRLSDLRREYDATVSDVRCHGSAEQKSRIVQIVDELESGLGHLRNKMAETKAIFERQLTKSMEPPDILS